MSLRGNCQVPLSQNLDSFALYPRKSYSHLIKFNAPSNCGYSFLGEIEIVNDTLNLIYQGYGTNCFGNCLFAFEYEIQKDIANENILDVNYVMINGNQATKTELSKKLMD